MTKPNEKQRKSIHDISHGRCRTGASKRNSTYTSSHADKASSKIEDQTKTFLSKGGKVDILPGPGTEVFKGSAKSVSVFD